MELTYNTRLPDDTSLDYDTDFRAGWWNGFCRGFALLQARPCELTPLPQQLQPT